MLPLLLLAHLLQVMEVYQDMLRTGCERSVITYSALISACEKAGQWQLALNLFGEMLRERCTPNVITYNSLITACAQVGGSGEGLGPYQQAPGLVYVGLMLHLRVF